MSKLSFPSVLVSVALVASPASTALAGSGGTPSDGSELMQVRNVSASAAPSALRLYTPAERVEYARAALRRGVPRAAIDVLFMRVPVGDETLDHEPLLALAFALAARTDRAKARPDLVAEAIEYHADAPDAPYKLAAIRYLAGDSAGERETIDRALQADPKSGRAYALLGDVREGSGDFAGAAEAYREALQLFEPSDAGTAARIAERERDAAAWATDLALVADPATTPARQLNNPQPIYTREALRSRTNGVVTVAVRIDERGAVDDARVLSALGHGLDEDALRVARELRFEPAARGGSAVRSARIVRVRYVRANVEAREHP